jgi:hypothetical protein
MTIQRIENEGEDIRDIIRAMRSSETRVVKLY